MGAALEIRNLHASVEDKPILRGVNLTVKQGEVHALMGPNGSGKSEFLVYRIFLNRDGTGISWSIKKAKSTLVTQHRLLSQSVWRTQMTHVNNNTWFRCAQAGITSVLDESQYF